MADTYRHTQLFDRVAPVYQWYFRKQIRSYTKVLRRYRAHLGVAQGSRVLDIGCSTGAFAYSLQQLGYQVIGVDASPAMVRHSRKNAAHCLQGHATAGLPFQDGSFDLVVSAYVLHGLGSSKRERVFHETAQLTRTKAVLHDFYRRGNPLVGFVEHLEGGDHFHFAELGEIVTGRKTGRESPRETIYFNTVGMGIEDVALARRIYERARALGMGQKLRLWETPFAV